jgi:hypothetical protein
VRPHKLGAAAAVLLAATCLACDPVNTSGFPNAATTGPSGTLRRWTGSLDFYRDGQVIQGYQFTLPGRGIYVAADNVVFRNCRFVMTGRLNQDFTMANLNNNRGTVFENVEFDGRSLVPRAITGSPVTVRRSEIHHVGNAVEAEGPLVITDNYIHDIYEPPGVDWHADGIQTPYSSDNVLVRHNTILMRHPSTAAINMRGAPADPATNVVVDRNLIAGGGYTVHAGYGSRYRVTNNVFSTRFFPRVGAFGIWYLDPSQDGDVTRTGNVIQETGRAAN